MLHVWKVFLNKSLDVQAIVNTYFVKALTPFSKVGNIIA